MEYEDLEFDEEKYWLGDLCEHGHDWNKTGHSLRYIRSSRCVECMKKSVALYRENSKVEVICANCSKVFFKSKGVINSSINSGYKKFYCSKECHSNSMNKTITFVCLVCGEEGVTTPKENKKYCSKECAGVASRKREFRYCENCGAEYYPIRDNQKYCSRGCSGEVICRENFKKLGGDIIFKECNAHNLKKLNARLYNLRKKWKGVIDEAKDIVDKKIVEEVAEICAIEELVYLNLVMRKKKGSKV